MPTLLALMLSAGLLGAIPTPRRPLTAREALLIGVCAGLTLSLVSSLIVEVSA